MREDCGQFPKNTDGNTPDCHMGLVSISIVEGPYGSRHVPESNTKAERSHMQKGPCYSGKRCYWINGECRLDGTTYNQVNYISSDFGC